MLDLKQLVKWGKSKFFKEDIPPLQAQNSKMLINNEEDTIYSEDPQL